MSEAKVWATSEDGKIEYVSLTRERLEEVVNLLKTYFFPYENIARAVGFAYRPDIITELADILYYVANDGVSVVAVDKQTGKAVGALLNCIEDKNSSINDTFKEYVKSNTHSEIKGLGEVAKKIKNDCDPLTLCNVDCLMELLFLVVPPEYSRRGIGLKLCEVSLELATLLYKGENVKTSLNDTQLPLEPRPQIVTSLFSSFKTQKIGRKLNFDILKSFSYDDFYYNGKSFTSIIGNETKGCTKEYKKLK